VDDLLDVLDARLVGAAEPEGIDRRVGDHLGDALVGARGADVEVAGELRGTGGIGLVRRPDAEDIGIAHPLPGLDVEAGVEAGTDEADTERSRHEGSGIR